MRTAQIVVGDQYLVKVYNTKYRAEVLETGRPRRANYSRTEVNNGVRLKLLEPLEPEWPRNKTRVGEYTTIASAMVVESWETAGPRIEEERQKEAAYEAAKDKVQELYDSAQDVLAGIEVLNKEDLAESVSLTRGRVRRNRQTGAEYVGEVSMSVELFAGLVYATGSILSIEEKS